MDRAMRALVKKYWLHAAMVAAAAAGCALADARTVGQAGDRAEAEAATAGFAERAVRFVKDAAARLMGEAPAPAPARAVGPIEPLARIQLAREERFAADRYRLEGDAAQAFERFVIRPLDSPEPIATAALLKTPSASTDRPKEFRALPAGPKTPFSRASIDAVSVALTPEKGFHLLAHKALTQDEFRFLSGLLLYARGDQCAVAAGLFHRYAQAPGAAGQANYYLAMCARQLGLESEFFERARRAVDAPSGSRYAARILKALPRDLPDDFVVPFGAALAKHLGAKGNLKIASEDPSILGDARYWIALYGARAGKYKTTSVNAAQVPEGHAKRLKAEFLMALAEHETGDQAEALKLAEALVAKAEASPSVDREFAANAALNLARMQFQGQRFKASTLNFLKVYKDHPQWLQSLGEMGWAQLRGGDYEGAIGNMYSIQSPYFKAVYKPESYVIRTIGYLNLCQYGDAYRTLTKLERQYRPWLAKMDAFAAANEKARAARTEAVRKFIAGGAKAEGEADGLPGPVLREMARHKDFLNQQKALNARLDERARFARLGEEADRALARARAGVTSSRKRIAELKSQIAALAKGARSSQDARQMAKKDELRADLEREFVALNGRFFEIDVMNEAKAAMPGFAAEASAGAAARLARLREGIERSLSLRLERMRTDLRQALDNNELLRYEVFAGAGENMRYQIAGGEKSHRVPANALPQSKSLRWDFDGEYWEDEVGHYRSSLANNCPESSIRGQARLEGGEEE